MPKLQTPLHVWFDGETEPRSVTSDQRDLAAWEVCKDYAAHARHMQARFVAWSAMHRAGDYTGTWAEFKSQCVEVESLVGADDGDGEGEERLDPGRLTPSATA
jgi:hypothetical protein